MRPLLALALLAAAPALALAPPHDATNGIDCYSCHATHAAPGQAFVPTGAYQEALCKSCHNPTGVAAAMSDVGVHVVDGGARTLFCGDCHDVHSPSTSTDPHAGGATAPNLSLLRSDVTGTVPVALSPVVFQQRPAQLAFGPAAAPWDGACQACHTSTAHHTNGASGDHDHFLGAACTQCHSHGGGFAPGAPHPADFGTGSVHGPQALAGLAGCEGCHGATLTGATGVPSCNQCHPGWRTNCVFCHGGTFDATGAPPVDTHGNTATTAVGVGAHRSHQVPPQGFSSPVACTECHVVPPDALTPGHVDGPRATVTFGPLASLAGGATWDPVTRTCSNVTCHGFGTPVWTIVDGTQAQCGWCHDLPPAEDFPGYLHGNFNHFGGDHQAFQCSYCHPSAWYPPGHMNGVPDLSSDARNCACH